MEAQGRVWSVQPDEQAGQALCGLEEQRGALRDKGHAGDSSSGSNCERLGADEQREGLSVARAKADPKDAAWVRPGTALGPVCASVSPSVMKICCSNTCQQVSVAADLAMMTATMDGVRWEAWQVRLPEATRRRVEGGSRGGCRAGPGLLIFSTHEAGGPAPLPGVEGEKSSLGRLLAGRDSQPPQEQAWRPTLLLL